MSDRQPLRKDDDLDRVPRARPPTDRHEPSTADTIRDLQGTAGNRAVAELLGPDATAPALATVQRDETGEGDEAPATAPGTMTIKELKLALPIESFQHQAGRPARGREPDTGGDVIVSFAEKHLDSRLMKAAADGREFAIITIQIGAVTVTLKKVVFSSVQLVSGSVVLQLNAGSIEFPTKEDTGSEDERGY